MIWIDFENKDPTQPLEGWQPWTKTVWQEWLNESDLLSKEVADLTNKALAFLDEGCDGEAKATFLERNKFIDDNSKHWGKLKPWLFALSHGKCWFTEALDIASHGEVEHYRPKKETRDLDGTVRDGYWWLAFDFKNLRGVGNVPNRKKGGWFPLHLGSRCSQYDARCEESEIPYLLDPANPYDPGLLAFDEEGNAMPLPGASDWERQRVEESIKRLKLNDHDALPEERRKVWHRVSEAVDLFVKARAAYHPTNNPIPRATMEEKARLIKESTKPNTELSSVARWCVLFRNDPALAKLVS